MKITLCGSIAFIDDLKSLAQDLEKLKHQVELPNVDTLKNGDGEPITVEEYYQIRKSPDKAGDWVWDRKTDAMNLHFNKIDWADVILVTNYNKKDVKDYIGANTLIEMGLAFYQKKPIFLLNSIPDTDCREEILGMKPTVINGDLSLLV